VVHLVLEVGFSRGKLPSGTTRQPKLPIGEHARVHQESLQQLFGVTPECGMLWLAPGWLQH